MITPHGLLDLPREVLRNIALHIYDPLELTQQDRLTWGIFSTVDMHQERQDNLATLIDLGKTCRRIRREVRVILFRCIRTPTTRHVEEVIRNRDGWARYVKSIIIDLSMFEQVDDSESKGSQAQSPHHITSLRSCWSESTLLTHLITSLPSVNHISFFADASDDSTLALLLASLIPHPSSHPIPPPTVPSSPSVFSSAEGFQPPLPLTARLKSFGWRQRAQSPSGYRSFAQSSTFVSTLHLLRHAHRLSFLVLDADMDEMYKEDVLAACKELALREAPIGEEAEKISLMLCGPIRGWNEGFLQDLVGTFSGIKELFIDRPLRKSNIDHETTFEAFASLVAPLSNLPHLQLLQVGSYIFSISLQTALAFHLAQSISSLLVLGLLGDEGETTWWGIWRRASQLQISTEEGVYHDQYDIALLPLGDGHLKRLQEEYGQHRSYSISHTPARVEHGQDQAMTTRNPSTGSEERPGIERSASGGMTELAGRSQMMSLDSILGRQ